MFVASVVDARFRASLLAPPFAQISHNAPEPEWQENAAAILSHTMRRTADHVRGCIFEGEAPWPAARTGGSCWTIKRTLAIALVIQFACRSSESVNDILLFALCCNVPQCGAWGSSLSRLPWPCASLGKGRSSTQERRAQASGAGVSAQVPPLIHLISSCLRRLTRVGTCLRKNVFSPSGSRHGSTPCKYLPLASVCL